MPFGAVAPVPLPLAGWGAADMLPVADLSVRVKPLPAYPARTGRYHAWPPGSPDQPVRSVGEGPRIARRQGQESLCRQGVADSGEQENLPLKSPPRWPDFGEQTYADSGERPSDR